jgi:hypothetical protein
MYQASSQSRSQNGEEGGSGKFGDLKIYYFTGTKLNNGAIILLINIIYI